MALLTVLEHRFCDVRTVFLGLTTEKCGFVSPPSSSRANAALANEKTTRSHGHHHRVDRLGGKVDKVRASPAAVFFTSHSGMHAVSDSSTFKFLNSSLSRLTRSHHSHLS